jgi:hypothetical protein
MLLLQYLDTYTATAILFLSNKHLAKVKNAWVTQNKKKNNCLSINYEGKLKNFRKVRKTGNSGL